MQKQLYCYLILVSLLTFSCGDDVPQTAAPGTEILYPTIKQQIKAPDPAREYNKFDYNLPESNYFFPVEITEIITTPAIGAFPNADPYSTAEKKEDAYSLKIKFKITNPYQEELLAPIPDYFWISPTIDTPFTKSTTFLKSCQCQIDNGTEVTDPKRREISKLPSESCSDNKRCLRFKPEETKEFIITFDDPIRSEIRELIFFGFDRINPKKDAYRRNELVFVLDIDQKKVVNELQF